VLWSVCLFACVFGGVFCKFRVVSSFVYFDLLSVLESSWSFIFLVFPFSHSLFPPEDLRLDMLDLFHIT
jgi:hypothetical protein